MHGISRFALPAATIPADNSLLQESVFFWTYPRIYTLCASADLKNIPSETIFSNRRS